MGSSIERFPLTVGRVLRCYGEGSSLTATGFTHSNFGEGGSGFVSGKCESDCGLDGKPDEEQKKRSWLGSPESRRLCLCGLTSEPLGSQM